MPRHNRNRHGARTRSLAKIKGVGPGLDAIADRERRSALINNWVAEHAGGLERRWLRHARTGLNRSEQLVVCDLCSHRIRPGERLRTTSWDKGDKLYALHYRREGASCWSDWLHHMTRRAAETALFDASVAS